MQSGTLRSTSETTPSSAASVERGTPYEQLVSVDSLQDVATAVVFSPDGRFIAASDRSKMIIHRLDQEDFPAVKAPIQAGRRAFVALAWTYFEKRQLYNIVAGSFDGEVSLWRLEGECKQAVHISSPFKFDEQITDISIERSVIPPSSHHTRVGVACADGTIRVLKLKSQGFEPTALFEARPYEDGVIPKNLHFARSSSCEEPCVHDDVQCATSDLLVFAYQGGVIARLDHEGKSVVNVVKGPGTMASVKMLTSVDQFIAYTGQEFELVSLLDGKSIRKFSVGFCKTLLAKHAAVCQNDRIFAGGSDADCAYVFDIASGEHLQSLPCPGSPIQRVSACTTPDKYLIAVAGGKPGKASQVIIYQAKREVPSSPVDMSVTPTHDVVPLYNPWSTYPMAVVMVLMVALYLHSYWQCVVGRTPTTAALAQCLMRKSVE